MAEVRPIELEGDAVTEIEEPEMEDVPEMDEDIDPELLDLLAAGNDDYGDDEND